MTTERTREQIEGVAQSLMNITPPIEAAGERLTLEAAAAMLRAYAELQGKVKEAHATLTRRTKEYRAGKAPSDYVVAYGDACRDAVSVLDALGLIGEDK